MMLEFTLAGAVLFTAYAVVVAGHFPTGLNHMLATIVAALTFALTQVIAIAAFGLHRHDRGPAASLVIRLALSSVLGACVCYLAFSALPTLDVYREAIPDALVLGAVGLVAVRIVMASGLHEDLLSHRVLVLGTGLDAATVEQAFRFPSESGMRIVGFYPIDRSEAHAVSPERV
jgi:FlaA1/EpsC-like NDP-sugar epimerase